MSDRKSTALVPVSSGCPALPRPPRHGTGDFVLVDEETTLRDRAQVERHLPDILGRALARAWIDPVFRAGFSADPKGTLAAFRLHLPASIAIDVVSEGGGRPMVIVNDTALPRPRRILYLQLVMVAGR